MDQEDCIVQRQIFPSVYSVTAERGNAGPPRWTDDSAAPSSSFSRVPESIWSIQFHLQSPMSPAWAIQLHKPSNPRP